MAIVLVFPPSFRHQGRMPSIPCWWRHLDAWKHHLNAQGSSSSLGPLPMINMGGFSSVWLLWFEAVVSPVHHLVYFKGVAIFPWQWAPTLFDNFIVTLPYSLVTITNPFQLGLQLEATLSKRPKLSSRTFCRQSWQPVPWYLNMWGSPQLLTSDQSQQHFPVSHCLNLTHCHSGWHHHCWPLPQSLYQDLWCSPRPLQPNCHQDQLWPWLD